TSSTLFPYTTLFRSSVTMALFPHKLRGRDERSVRGAGWSAGRRAPVGAIGTCPASPRTPCRAAPAAPVGTCHVASRAKTKQALRSEEHTSELQSREN